MIPPAAAFAAILLVLFGAAPQTAADAARDRQRNRLLEVHREAALRLEESARPGHSADDRARLRGEAALKLEALADEGGKGEPAPALLPAPLVEELRRAAAALRQGAPATLPEPAPVDPLYRDLLGRVAARLKSPTALGLTFQGSYAQTKVTEPAYGGHASAMGPPPTDPRPPKSDAGPSPVTFEERPGLTVKTFGGGATRDHLLESGGTGVAVFDFDGDGRPDIYVVNAFELTPARERVPHRNALYRNLGGWKFEDVSGKAGVGVAGWGSGACVGDYDDDGHLDLYVTHYGPNVLFRNRGDGAFQDVAAKAGVQAPGWSTGCAFFDADADGDLDLYVARYVSARWDDVRDAKKGLVWRGGPETMVGPVGLPGEADVFFENRGDGTFAEAAAAHGLADGARAYGFGVVATDYDDDGRVDLYVANDTNPNFLYRNRGDGRFESLGLVAGVALNAEGRAQAGMGVDSGDYDGDGLMDLVVTNFAHDTNTLYRNLGGGQFEDATLAAGLGAPTFVRMGWGTTFFDADLDGDLDLFFANGHIYPDVEMFPQLQETFRQKNQLFLNDAGHFRDVSETAGAGLQVQKSSRGLATGDFDGDGDLDLVVTNMDDVPTLLENRQGTGHHWVAFRVRHPGKNRFGIGARVTVTAGGRRHVREIRSGGSYVSQSDLVAHFGLGEQAAPIDVEVRMPGGARWQWKGLPADRLHVLALDDAARAARTIRTGAR